MRHFPILQSCYYQNYLNKQGISHDFFIIDFFEAILLPKTFGQTTNYKFFLCSALQSCHNRNHRIRKASKSNVMLSSTTILIRYNFKLLRMSIGRVFFVAAKATMAATIVRLKLNDIVRFLFRYSRCRLYCEQFCSQPALCVFITPVSNNLFYKTKTLVSKNFVFLLKS